ncbi:MAG: SsrA-binding protein SmpB [Phycisphaerae bacterium]|nr:MAG: SsrA-binding protein SmpB [Planctomycetota bacterium]KAB2948732.1 MAG: SsrA-binding protein SmpB [Phycisphaerae bacterium]MBE7456807.1 SsrA-binding protein SmpB [Planctomycetia bacterium]MCK6464256.1 SsrA-binding protein SmpB [Phycisphaerae bacterium]MCL4717847.1 SsrA-binding protein SmpB [Phycisphaerae bacterium]
MSKKPESPSAVCRNRNAAFKFEILEKTECGIVLLGSEVKSLRTGRASLDEAFARFRDGAIWLFAFHIPPYEQAGPTNHEPTRPRKLLLKRSELQRIEAKLQQKGLTLIPTSAYFNERGLLKITLGLARGKKLHDRRQSLRERDDRRQMQRAERRSR